jgi:hypothetical protein
MYVTLNTLLDLITSENIIRFDSDDVMCSEMVSAIMYNAKNADVVRFGYINFNPDDEDKLDPEFAWNKTYNIAHSILYYNKKIINLLGGYRSWICAADTEFVERIDKLYANKIKNELIDNYLFFRRIHPNSLTRSEETGYDSKLRKEYIKKTLDIKKNDVVFINKTTNEYEEL